MPKPPHWKPIDLPPPPIPEPVKFEGAWNADIQCRFSSELEPRLLSFDEETKQKYDNIRAVIEQLSDNQCYWEGLEVGILYAEFNFDNDAFLISHHCVMFENKELGIKVYDMIEKHYPQKHRPYMGLKYIKDEEFVRQARQFPPPYQPVGFAKLFHTRYDREMEAVYNIMPGFSTPIPDIKAVQLKMRHVMALRGKPHAVGMLHKFGCSSILDIDGENLYHLDSAADYELRKYAEEHPRSRI